VAPPLHGTFSSRSIVGEAATPQPHRNACRSAGRDCHAPEAFCEGQSRMVFDIMSPGSARPQSTADGFVAASIGRNFLLTQGSGPSRWRRTVDRIDVRGGKTTLGWAGSPGAVAPGGPAYPVSGSSSPTGWSPREFCHRSFFDASSSSMAHGTLIEEPGRSGIFHRSRISPAKRPRHIRCHSRNSLTVSQDH